MAKFDILGYNFNFQFQKKNWDNPEIYSANNMLKEKIFYFIIIMSLFVLSSKVNLFFRSENYKVGNIVKTDIYAPKSIIYKDENAKNKIIEHLIITSKKEYIFISSVEEYYIKIFDESFKNLDLIRKNKEKYNISFFNENLAVKMPESLIKELLLLPRDNFNKIREETKILLSQIYKKGVFQEEKFIKIDGELEEKIKKLSEIQNKLINIYTIPNYIYDPEKTKNSIKEKVLQIKDQFIYINAGDLIIKKGEILAEDNIEILQAIGISSIKKIVLYFILNILYLCIIGTIFYFTTISLLKKDILNRNFYKSTVLIIVSTFAIYRFFPSEYIYLVPFDALLFLLLILTNINFSLIFSFFSLAYILPMIDFNSKYFIINIFAIILGSYLVKKITTRAEVLSIGIKLSIVKVLLYIVLTVFLNDESSSGTLKAIELLISGIISGMITLALVPYFEKTFNLLDIFKLLELGDLSNPLLKRLSIEAPGTFQHSMMVATLSENAAETIGASSIFCRVSSYYHDIGKIKRPGFYVENQNPGENPHDKTSPSMSCLIIKAHTKDGVEIGKKNKLPREIRDIMLEHQGTTFLAYFYNKAKKLDPSVKISDFKYSGPKPKTKESAIIMLADSIEAAVRSIDEKTPITIEVMVRKIISNKIDENQLIDADLTFREIEIIIESFVKTLISIHHVRIKYPNQK
ncbi:MAG: HD family phosphohydrolase [Fusobacteriaceae bacterium]